MKIELICDEPNELRFILDDYGRENVEVVIPDGYTEDSYWDKINEDLGLEELKIIKVRIPVQLYTMTKGISLMGKGEE
jgi:hypothetical protein